MQEAIEPDQTNRLRGSEIRIVLKSELPELPQGYLRITHHTNLQNAVEISQMGLDYSSQGMAMSVARAYSSSQEVEYFSSDPRFGHSGIFIVVFDLPKSEWRLHNNVAASPGVIPPEQIVGIVRCEAMPNINEKIDENKDW